MAAEERIGHLFSSLDHGQFRHRRDLREGPDGIPHKSSSRRAPRGGLRKHLRALALRISQDQLCGHTSFLVFVLDLRESGGLVKRQERQPVRERLLAKFG
jgi:hypothetical protein